MKVSFKAGGLSEVLKMHADTYYMSFFSISFLVFSFMTSFSTYSFLISSVQCYDNAFGVCLPSLSGHCVFVLPLHSSTGKQAPWITDGRGLINKRPPWSHHHILPIFDIEQALRELAKWRNELWVRRIIGVFSTTFLHQKFKCIK